MLELLVGVVMVLGLIGTIVPVMPGLVVILGAGIVYGVVDGFGATGLAAITAMAILFALGSVASYVLPHRAGVLAGVGKPSLRLGMLGGIVGLFAIPGLGLPIGAALGVLVGERRRLGDWSAAWATTRRVLVGFGLGALAEVLAGLAMIAAWAIWAATA